MKVLTIDGREHDECEMCKKIDELRPYGPNGEKVCFPCAMKDEEAAKKQYFKLLDGHDVVIIK